MKILCNGSEVEVTAVHMSDGGVVMHTRTTSDNLSAQAANACLPQPGPNDGILDEARSLRDETRKLRDGTVKSCTAAMQHEDRTRRLHDEVRTLKQDCEGYARATQAFASDSESMANRCAGLLGDCNAAVVKALGAADNANGYARTAQACRNEAKGFAESAQEHRTATEGAAIGAADPEPSFDPDGEQHADTLSREQLKERWHKAADERDKARQKYTVCKAALLREEERHNLTSERLRTAIYERDAVRKERDEWKAKARHNSELANLVKGGDDERARISAQYDEVVRERDEWKRRAEQLAGEQQEVSQ